MNIINDLGGLTDNAMKQISMILQYKKIHRNIVVESKSTYLTSLFFISNYNFNRIIQESIFKGLPSGNKLNRKYLDGFEYTLADMKECHVSVVELVKTGQMCHMMSRYSSTCVGNFQ